MESAAQALMQSQLRVEYRMESALALRQRPAWVQEVYLEWLRESVTIPVSGVLMITLRFCMLCNQLDHPGLLETHECIL